MLEKDQIEKIESLKKYSSGSLEYCIGLLQATDWNLDKAAIAHMETKAHMRSNDQALLQGQGQSNQAQTAAANKIPGCECGGCTNSAHYKITGGCTVFDPVTHYTCKQDLERYIRYMLVKVDGWGEPRPITVVLI